MRSLLILISIIWGGCLTAQIGGQSSFNFLLLPSDARIAALGGEHISSIDEDPNLQLYNPASLTDSANGQISFNFRPYFADINKVTASTAFNYGPKVGVLGVAIQHIGYGTLEQTDAAGNVIGEFRASETALSVTKSHTLDDFTIGGTLKYASSRIAGFNSSALLIDIGGTYKHPKQDLVIGLVAKNIGISLGRFTPEQSVNLPFDLQAGISYKFKHNPLRFTTTIHNLYRYDIQFLDTTRNITLGEDGEEIIPQESFSEQIARHFVFGAELIFSKKFQLRVGYNHIRRRELRTVVRSGGAGFSFGAMLKIRSTQFNFTRSYFHPVGGTTTLTVTTNISKYISKKRSGEYIE